MMNRANGDSLPVFTPRQGQYLAFIHAYTLVNGRPPAQADIQRFFQVTPPSVHQMLLTLERGGLVFRDRERREASRFWSIVPSYPRWSRDTVNRS
jgi:DNA-binding MarR family transcriptional regulator